MYHHHFIFNLSIFSYFYEYEKQALLSIIVSLSFNVPWSLDSFFPVSFYFSHRNISKYAVFEFIISILLALEIKTQNLGHVRKGLQQCHTSSAKVNSFLISWNRTSLPRASGFVFKDINRTHIHEFQTVPWPSLYITHNHFILGPNFIDKPCVFLQMQFIVYGNYIYSMSLVLP